MGIGLNDIFTSQTAKSIITAEGGPASPATVQSTELALAGVLKNGLEASQYFDQGCRMDLRLAAPEEIALMRKRWMDKSGLEPELEVAFTDDQLSVLFRLSECG